MKNIVIIICLFFALQSCKSKPEKVRARLNEWFNGFDSVKKYNEKKTAYIKDVDLSTKEVVIETLIDEELESKPVNQKIAVHNEYNQTVSDYEWNAGNNKVFLHVLYTDPTTTKGMRFTLLIEKN